MRGIANGCRRLLLLLLLLVVASSAVVVVVVAYAAAVVLLLLLLLLCWGFSLEMFARFSVSASPFYLRWPAVNVRFDVPTTTAQAAAATKTAATAMLLLLLLQAFNCVTAEATLINSNAFAVAVAVCHFQC